MKNLSGKRALITGAGGALGRELSLAFADAGVEIVATDIDHTQLAETVRLVNASGGQASGKILDVTSSQDVRRLRREIDPIDILVNNAGIVTGGSFVDVAVDQHEAVFAVNAVGPMLVMHTFLPGLIRRPEAHLVTIASASSFLPMPLQVSYAASKWAALGLSDAIRQELRIMGNKHVRVTAVCPSYIDTEMFQGARMPFLTRALPPRLVAHSVVRAVKRNKNHLLMPWPVHLICLGKALLPLWLGEKICDWFGITNGMSTWIGHQGKTQEAAATIPVQLGSLSEVQVKQG